MVTCDFIGRLGNNMFQIATTYALARKYNTEPMFPEFKYFNLPALTKEVQNVYNEKRHTFQEIPNMPDMKISGFFQTEKYFLNIREQLINDVFKVPKLIEPIGVEHTVAIHLRRTDYLELKDKHPVPPLSYYYSAMQLFKGKNFLVFSDDIEYAKFNFTFPKVTIVPQGDALEDLYLMANCSDFIIANSSYSWWGAWLSRNFNKTIISPTKGQWFGPNNSHLDTADLIPDYFTQKQY